jgi:hypothetical protein
MKNQASGPRSRIGSSTVYGRKYAFASPLQPMRRVWVSAAAGVVFTAPVALVSEPCRNR